MTFTFASVGDGNRDKRRRNDVQNIDITMKKVVRASRGIR
jgi:hypothetical protein